MKKRIQILPLLCWILVIGVTATVYALIVDGLFSAPVKWISLCFVLLAELALCAKATAGRKSIIFNVNGMTGAMYLVAAVILSAIYINLTDPNIKWFVAIHVVLLGALTVIDLTILNFDKRVSGTDRTIEKNRGLMVLVDTIIAENPKSEFKKELLELSEVLRYSDHSKFFDGDEEILTKIVELREAIKNPENAEEISAKIQTVKALVHTRSIYIKENQRGKI